MLYEESKFDDNFVLKAAEYANKKLKNANIGNDEVHGNHLSVEQFKIYLDLISIFQEEYKAKVMQDIKPDASALVEKRQLATEKIKVLLRNHDIIR